MPAGAADFPARLAPFAAAPAHSVVIVDFDGTLAPIVADPPAARPLPEAAPVLGRLAASYGLRLEPGRRTLELRPPLDVDKGTATEQLAAGASAAMFVGDDRGDVAAFDVLSRLVEEGQLAHAVRVVVRSPETPAELLGRADLAVDGPHGAVELLDRLGEMLATARPSTP